MRSRIEITGEEHAEELVIYCHQITPRIESVLRLVRQLDQQQQSFSFFKGEEQFYLNLKEILFFETDDDRVYAHTADQAYEVKLRLYELEAMLPGYFARVSKSAITSILHIFSIQKSLTRVSHISFRNSHKEVYCSRMYSNELFRRMNERYLYENE